MGDRRGFILLFLIMTVTAVAMGAIAIGTLYAAQMQASRQMVTEVARLQAHLLQSNDRALDAARAGAAGRGDRPGCTGCWDKTDASRSAASTARP